MPPVDWPNMYLNNENLIYYKGKVETMLGTYTIIRDTTNVKSFDDGAEDGPLKCEDTND